MFATNAVNELWVDAIKKPSLTDKLRGIKFNGINVLEKVSFGTNANLPEPYLLRQGVQPNQKIEIFFADVSAEPKAFGRLALQLINNESVQK